MRRVENLLSRASFSMMRLRRSHEIGRFLFRLLIKGIPKWRRSYASSTRTQSTAIQNPMRATFCPELITTGLPDVATPKAIDFKPGALLGSVSGELGLRKYLESNGHTFVVISDKDGPGSVFERELPDAGGVISQPFWPAYLTADRIARPRS